MDGARVAYGRRLDRQNAQKIRKILGEYPGSCRTLIDEVIEEDRHKVDAPPENAYLIYEEDQGLADGC